MPLSDLEAVLAAAFGAPLASFIVWVGRRLYLLGRKYGKKIDSIAEQVDSVSARVKKIEPVVQELMPNGGTSLRDVVNGIEKKVIILDGRTRANFQGDDKATYECDAAGKCTYASAALARLFGLPAEELLGTGWLRAVRGPGERERVWKAWQDAIRVGIPYEDFFTVANQGLQFRVRTYTADVRWRDGKVLCYFGMVEKAEPDSQLGGGNLPATPPPPPPPAEDMP